MDVLNEYDNYTHRSCYDHAPNENNLIYHLVIAAREQCEWIIVFDLDEYVTGVDPSKYFRDFYSFLTSPAYPVSKDDANHWNALRMAKRAPRDSLGCAIKRLAWMVMGNEGYEVQPPHKLIIETFWRGRYEAHRHLKTVSRCASAVNFAYSRPLCVCSGRSRGLF